MDPITLMFLLALLGGGAGAGLGQLIGGNTKSTLTGAGIGAGAGLLGGAGLGAFGAGAGAGAGAGTEFGALPLLGPTGATLSPEVFGAAPASAAFGPSVGGAGGAGASSLFAKLLNLPTGSFQGIGNLQGMVGGIGGGSTSQQELDEQRRRQEQEQFMAQLRRMVLSAQLSQFQTGGRRA